MKSPTPSPGNAPGRPRVRVLAQPGNDTGADREEPHEGCGLARQAGRAGRGGAGPTPASWTRWMRPGNRRRAVALHALAAAAWAARPQPVDPGWLDMAWDVPVLSSRRARDARGWALRHDPREVLAGAARGMVHQDGVATPALRPRRWSDQLSNLVRHGAVSRDGWHEQRAAGHPRHGQGQVSVKSWGPNSCPRRAMGSGEQARVRRPRVGPGSGRLNQQLPRLAGANPQLGPVPPAR